MRAGGAVGLGAIAAVLAGAGPSDAVEAGVFDRRVHPDPATSPQPNPPYPKDLTPAERRHLKTFDELDFVVYSGQQWDRIGESHASDVRVHMPDGSTTDGIEPHVASLRYLFTFAPDTRIKEHPIRIAKGQLTAVTGVLRGTFTQPMMTPDGQTVPANGRAFAVNLVTVGSWDRRGKMGEEWLFLDNATFFGQLGLA